MSLRAFAVVVVLAACRGGSSRDAEREQVAEALLHRTLAREAEAEASAALAQVRAERALALAASAEPIATRAPFANPFPDDTPEAYAFEAAREGFSDRPDIIEWVDGTSEVALPRRKLEAAVDAALARYRAVEESWAGRTDCDRLDAAFATLERAGIVARQDFSDCGNCGTGEMLTLVGELTASGQKVRGWTFFHDQDTEHAASGDGLFLMHGASGGADPVAITNEIVSVLRAEGLDARWSGLLDDRITVAMDWRKRMFTTAPPRRPSR